MSTSEEKHGERSRPANKATFDQPQEEFIQAYPSYPVPAKDHGNELEHVSHRLLWGEHGEW
jgi:hypothetical protein